MTRRLKSQSFWYVIGILAAAALILWPLTRPGFIVTDDGDWMIIRLSAFFQSFREGQFPVRFLGRLNYSYGYPVANFLYPGFLYLGSLIHALGFSFPDTVKIIFGASLVASALAIFSWLKLHFKPLPSFIGALNFVFSPYLLFDIYKRGSVGEVLAFLPAALGFYSVDANKNWLLPLAVGFLLVSHNSLAFMFLVILAIYIAVRKLYSLAVPYALGVGSAAFFWFPALFERRFVIFDQITVSDPTRYFIQGQEFFLLGFSAVAAGSLLLVIGNKLGRPLFGFFITILVLGIILATPLGSFLWSNKILIHLFQFPVRFLAPVVVAGAWLVAYVLEFYLKKPVGKLVILLTILWLVPLFPLLGGVKTVEHPIGFYTTNEATTTVRDEYMPRWVTDKPQSRASQKVVVFKGLATVKMNSSSSQHIDATIGAQDKSVIQINTIFYPGWGVTIDGQPAPFTYLNPLGVIRVALTPGTHRVEAEFRETVPRFLADALSLVSGVGAVTYAVFNLRTRGKLSQPSSRASK